MHAGCAMQNFADSQRFLKAMRSKKIDLISAHKLLQTAAKDKEF